MEHPKRNQILDSDSSVKLTHDIGSEPAVLLLDRRRAQPTNFIVVAEPLSGPTDKQKREVRAYAMRDYHKRRKGRASKELATLRPLTASSEERGQTTSNRPLRPLTTSLYNQSLSCRHESRSSSDLDPGQSGQSRIRGVSKTSLESANGVHASGLPEFDRWQYDMCTPYALCMGSGAPTLIIQARQWPFVQHACGATPGISLWMPEMSIPRPSAYSNRPCLLKSSKTVAWIGNSTDYLEYKGETVKWINSRLGDAQLGLSQETIGVILALANWEIARGNTQELDHHMSGLQVIINLRGGINTLSSVHHFQTKIALVDLLVAALGNSRPRFPPFFIPRPHVPLSAIEGLKTGPILDSPIYGTQRIDQVFGGSPFGALGIQLLQKMKDMTAELLTDLTPTQSGMTRGIELESGEHPSVFTFEEYNENLLLPHLLLTPLIHAARIYFNVLSPVLTSPLASLQQTPYRNPFSSSQNQRSLECLVQSLQFPTHDATFTQYPGILIWILLVGAVAAEGRPERGFLVMFLSRTGVGSEYGWWDEMREMFETFRRVRQIVG